MHILIAEDNPKVSRLLVEALKEAHFTPDVALTAEDTSYKLRINDYDLVILDWYFENEKINGMDLIKEIRAKKINLPILMLTSKYALMDKIIGLKAGADDYITKPFHIPELITRIQVLLRRSYKNQNEDARILKNGPLTLDIFSHVVTLKEKPLALNNKEFQVIKLLLIKLNDVVTRSELIEKVWGDTAGKSLSNTVDVYISHLREKIGPLQKQLQTVRGIGYRFKKID